MALNPVNARLYSVVSSVSSRMKSRFVSQSSGHSALTEPFQVAQLVGYISEKTAYHHGEQSLTMTIVGLAQNFVGSNNINLLKPEGQFGTRARVSRIAPW